MKKHYWVDTEAFFENNETFKLETLAFNKGMGFTLNHNGYKAKIYVLELGKILTSEKVPIFKSSETFNGVELATAYVNGYKKGREYFKNEFGLTPNVFFNNPEPYIKNLHHCYYHKEPVTGKNGWIYYLNTYPDLFTEDKIEDYGFAAGIFFEIDELKKKYAYIFKDFETLCGLHEMKQDAHTITQKNEQVSGKPVLKPEAVDAVFVLIKDFFPGEEHSELKRRISTGNDGSGKLHFNGNGNRLTDTFKKLFEHGFIVGCQKRELINWVIKNFNYRHKKVYKEYVFDTVEKVISRNHYPCKNPVIDVSAGEIIQVQIPTKRNIRL
jgi:hypothetical protein